MGINLPKARAIELLERSLSRMGDLTLQDHMDRSGAYQKWQRDTGVAVRKIFGDDSSHSSDFIMEVYSHVSYGFENVTVLLKSMIDEIKEFGDDDDSSQSRPAQDPDASTRDKRSVFIVHGHDEPAKLTVKDFLKELHLNPIILSDKASEGNTIIAKFQKHAQVAFAVVLMTPDDKGARKRDVKMSCRARQNVIFEFGFFLGELGMEKVRLLRKGEVEIPSDYSGVEYIDFDDKGGWKLKLAQEMKDAGLEFDMNRLSESR